jgi:RND superfamily putative drug exporter
MFKRLGHMVSDHPLICISCWIIVALLLAALSPDPARLKFSEPASLVPVDAPINRAMALHREAFPNQASQSQAVLLFHRPGGLRASDREFIGLLALELAAEGRRPDQEAWRVRAAAQEPYLQLRLRSTDGEAEMVVVDLDVIFVTSRATKAVESIEQIFRGRLPDGLTCEVTGSAGLGREHNIRSRQALERTTLASIVAVLVLLIMVYRSPLGALVPLLSISLSVYVAFQLLGLLAWAGCPVSNAERTFTVVLLFGAGTDYALFWISRYREELSRGSEVRDAALDAMSAVGPAILASAATTVAGLTILALGQMVILRNSGRILGLVLTISLLAAVTLTPALAVVLRKAFFWPGRLNGRGTIGQRLIWPRLAMDVVRRPWAVFVCGCLTLVIPALAALELPIRFDTFDEIPLPSSAGRGLELANRHFSRDELFSSRILLRADGLNTTLKAEEVSRDLATGIAAIDGVTDVWHLAEPLGSHGGVLAHLLLPFKSQVLDYYFSKDHRLLQLEVMQRHSASSLEALQVYEDVRSLVQTSARRQLGQGFEVLALGTTPYTADIVRYAKQDLRTILVGVTAVIWLIVLACVRRFWLSVFMLAATLLTYAASLGLTEWVFVDLLGHPGIDYNIQIFVFVIIVAVGQDYNIFLVSRIRQEAQRFELGQAVARAVVVTGPVITSCGLIMAATLGSIATTDAGMMKQLGFALAVGILLDTFLVRPLLVPSFCLLTDRVRLRSLLPQPVPSES